MSDNLFFYSRCSYIGVSSVVWLAGVLLPDLWNDGPRCS